MKETSRNSSVEVCRALGGCSGAEFRDPKNPTHYTNLLISCVD